MQLTQTETYDGTSAADCGKPMVLYNGDELDPTLIARFAVTVFTAKSPSRSSQLTITDIELGDSGTYSCAEADTFSTQRHFILDVLGMMSKMASNDDDDDDDDDDFCFCKAKISYLLA